MYTMIIKNKEQDISKERILYRYNKLVNNTEKGYTNIIKIILINENGEILREYGTNKKPYKHI